MRRLQIGMWHNMSEKEWGKWSLGMITGLEASQYESHEEIERLQSFCSENHLAYGFHSPVFHDKNIWLPQITSNYATKREEAVRWIEKEVGLASKYGAEYILFHYPFPSITPREIDLQYWPSKPSYPILEWNELSKEEFLEWSHEIFKTLIDLQERYNQKIVLEYDFFGEYEDVFLNMFEEYKEIQLVLDTQRLDVNKRAFPMFDPYSFIKKAAPLVYLVHHSTTKYGVDDQRHFPVLPENEGDPSFGDAHSYLEYLAMLNPTFHIHFEHNPRLVTIEQLKECYEAAKRVMDKNSYIN